VVVVLVVAVVWLKSFPLLLVCMSFRSHFGSRPWGGRVCPLI
jgi:hypothetical protein